MTKKNVPVKIKSVKTHFRQNEGRVITKEPMKHFLARQMIRDSKPLELEAQEPERQG